MTPCDLRIEQSLLGECLMSPAQIGCVDGLRPEHFAAPEHGDLWAEMLSRYRDDRAIDALSLKPWAMAHAAISQLGANGSYLLTLCATAGVTSAQLREYAAMLRVMARRRAVIEAARGAIATAECGESDALTWLEGRLQEIASSDADADAWEHGGASIIASVERAELGEARGISTGIRKLDDITGGIKPGLWVVGGATSMGKSIVLAAIARAIAAQGYGVGEHHLEMTSLQIDLRTAAALAFTPDHRDSPPHYLSAMRGALRPEQWDRLRGAAKAAAHLPIWRDTRAGRSVSQIEAASRRLIRKWQRQGIAPGAILIDHEGLIAPEPGARFPSQLERTNARSEALMAMAKRLGICVIAASQITKEGARADGDERLPTLLDLNYGGAISQAADVVILIHRRAYYEERKPSHLRDVDRLRSREAVLVVDKARDGRRAQVPILMDMPTAAVWEAAA